MLALRTVCVCVWMRACVRAFVGACVRVCVRACVFVYVCERERYAHRMVIFKYFQFSHMYNIQANRLLSFCTQV